MMTKYPTQPRRTFIKNTLLAGTALTLTPTQLYASGASKRDDLHISIFSKHLQFLDYTHMAEAAKDIGFDGVDLTVRPNGHVLPENVVQDMPRAAEALNKHELTPNMFTTSVWDVKNPQHVQVLEEASKAGFKYYRASWLKYKNPENIEKELLAYNGQMKALAQLNKKLKLSGGYQNHAGTSIGASVWDLKSLLKNISPQNIGIQYDIRHATVEGANSWKIGFHLIKNQINSIVLKDFKWGKEQGKWKPINTPMGEGMVDFKSYFKLLKQYKINVPVSLHLEYNLGGAEKGKSKLSIPQKEVFKAMKKDLNYIRNLWNDVQ